MGSAGNDIYVLEENDNHIEVCDFIGRDGEEDKIELSAVGFSGDFGELMIFHTNIQHGSLTIYLE